MRRPGRTGDLRRSLSFGGRVPPVLGLLLALVLIATVGSWIVRDAGWAALAPEAIRRGELWRLGSWVLVQDQPLTLLFGGFVLYSFGSQLVYDWGESRFFWTFAAVTVGAALVTVLIALVWPPFWAFTHVGMWPVVDGLLLMWALRYPDQQLNFWGVLPMTGRTVALLLVFGTAIYGLFIGGVSGLLQVVPHFAALLVGWSLSRRRLSTPFRRWKLGWRDFWLERQLRRRSRHLKVVKKNGQGGEPPSWMN
jgi:membrane associated rhomboid family serine protease